MTVHIDSIVGEIATDDAGDLPIDCVVGLRAAMEMSRRVDWVCAGDLSTSAASVYEHLAPPKRGGGLGGDRWRDRHRVGACYYRRGPRFLSVRDRRSTFEGATYTLRSSTLLGCVDLLVDGSPHVCEACESLESYGLARGFGAGRLFLPYRLRYPPVPFLAV